MNQSHYAEALALLAFWAGDFLGAGFGAATGFLFGAIATILPFLSSSSSVSSAIWLLSFKFHHVRVVLPYNSTASREKASATAVDSTICENRARGR